MLITDIVLGFLSQVKQLNNVGGSNSRDFTRRVLRKLMTLNVSQNFSLAGRSGKRAFRNTNLWVAVSSAVTQANRNASERDVELATGDFLKHANDGFRPHL